MSNANKMKDIGGAFAGVIALIAFASIGIGILYGAAELSLWAIEWMPTIFGAVFLLCILVFLPLSFIPPTRGFAGNALYFASYIFGLILWILAMAYTYSVWGLFAVIVGLLVFGVGVVPIAILAAIIEGQWSILGNLVLLIALTFGLRVLGYWLIEKAGERAIRIAEAKMKKELTEPARRID